MKQGLLKNCIYYLLLKSYLNVVLLCGRGTCFFLIQFYPLERRSDVLPFAHIYNKENNILLDIKMFHFNYYSQLIRTDTQNSRENWSINIFNCLFLKCRRDGRKLLIYFHFLDQLF